VEGRKRKAAFCTVGKRKKEADPLLLGKKRKRQVNSPCFREEEEEGKKKGGEISIPRQKGKGKEKRH